MIHILFSTSAAGTLRQVLRDRGLDQRVVDFSDSLDWGPISEKDTDRQRWFNEHAPMDFGECDWIEGSGAKFAAAIATDVERLIWIAPRSAEEQAGLHWYLSRFSGIGAQFIVADYALHKTWKNEFPLSLGQLNQDLFSELLEDGPRVPWDPVQFPDAHWARLVEENALLRIVKNGHLVSAPEDHFDSLIVDRCPASTTKSHRVLADVMGDMWKLGHHSDLSFLIWRLRHLIQNGDISCDGDLPLFGAGPKANSKIRLAS